MKLYSSPGACSLASSIALREAGASFDAVKVDLRGKKTAGGDAREYLMGLQFTVADAYLYTVLRWAPIAGLDLEKWPALRSYAQRVGARPHVQAALKAEGLDEQKSG